MSRRNDGMVYKLTSDGNPIFVGVDYGRDDITTECEVEMLPDGTVRVLDIREVPKIERDL